MSEERQRRDRELENLFGQFLVASFQSDKLADMLYEKLPFGGPKEVRLLVPQRDMSRQSLLVTVRIEPYPGKVARTEENAEGMKSLCVLESPSLNIEPRALRNRTQDLVEESMQRLINERTYRNLDLEDWRVNVSVIDGKDSRRLSRLYTLLGNLEAKRKGELTR